MAEPAKRAQDGWQHARDAAPGALRVVQVFVNSDDDDGSDEYATPAGVARWLQSCGLLEPGTNVTRAEQRTAVELRAALRALLLANHDRVPRDEPDARAVLDRVARRGALEVHFEAPGSAALRATAPGARGAFATVVAAVYDAMRDGTWSRMKACRNDECQWAFYDHSRNRSGAWCNMETCGSVMKMRAYRERKRTTAGTSR